MSDKADKITADKLIQQLIFCGVDRDVAFKVGGIAADYALKCYTEGYMVGYNCGYDEGKGATTQDKE